MMRYVERHGTGARATPPVTESNHLLPLLQLDASTFERLCLWLVRAEGFTKAEHYGAAGSDGGRDIVAFRGSDPWYFQCKRRSRLLRAHLEAEVAEVASGVASRFVDLPSQPVTMVFVVTSLVSARLRDAVSSFAAERGLACEFWAATELDERIKRHPELVQEFFGVHPGWFVEDEVVVPRRPPHAPLRFVNRTLELASLDRPLDRFRQSDPAYEIGSFVWLAASVPVWQSLDRPGVTTIVGGPAVGKTVLSFAIASRGNYRSRRIVFRAARYPTFGALLETARAELAGHTRPGDVVIIDGLDEMDPMPAPEEVSYGTRQSWLADARVILTQRPAAAAFGAHITLSVGPAPQIAEDGTYYWGDLVRLAWTQQELSEAVYRQLDGSRAQKVLAELLATNFLGDTGNGGLKLLALQRLLLTDQPPETPSVVLAADANGRIKVLPATSLPDTSITLEGTDAPIRAGLIVPFKASRKLWIPEAAALEELINDPAVTEATLQEFLEAHPHVLAGVDYERIVPHPRLERTDQGDLIPDFMLEPKSGAFANILDLKRPQAKVVVGSRDRLHPSAAITEAAAQLREYRAWFDDPAHQQQFRDRYKISAYKPSVIVVIGRDPEADPYQLTRLWEDLPPALSVLTYDDLLRRIRRLGTQ